MVAYILTAAVLAAPGVASLPLQTVNVDAKVGELALTHIAERLSQQGVQVMTPSEIQAILGLERQKQLLGCSELATACPTELADALGADATMVGTLGKLGDTFELSIKVVSNRTGQRRAGFTERVKSEGELFAMLDRAAAAAPLHARHGRHHLARRARAPGGHRSRARPRPRGGSARLHRGDRGRHRQLPALRGGRTEGSRPAIVSLPGCRAFR